MLGGVTTGLGVGETESMQDLVSNSPYCVYGGGGTGASSSTYGGAELNSECSRSLMSQTTAQTSVYGLSTNYHFREGEFDLLRSTFNIFSYSIVLKTFVNGSIV